MKPDQVKHMLKYVEVFRAYSEGKAIQVRNTTDNSGWLDYEGTQINFGYKMLEWRIKPIQRRYCMVVDSKTGESIAVFPSVEEGEACVLRCDPDLAKQRQIIEVQEVLKEGKLGV